MRPRAGACGPARRPASSSTGGSARPSQTRTPSSSSPRRCIATCATFATISTPPAVSTTTTRNGRSTVTGFAGRAAPPAAALLQGARASRSAPDQRGRQGAVVVNRWLPVAERLDAHVVRAGGEVLVERRGDLRRCAVWDDGVDEPVAAAVGDVGFREAELQEV